MRGLKNAVSDAASELEHPFLYGLCFGLVTGYFAALPFLI